MRLNPNPLDVTSAPFFSKPEGTEGVMAAKKKATRAAPHAKTSKTSKASKASKADKRKAAERGPRGGVTSNAANSTVGAPLALSVMLQKALAIVKVAAPVIPAKSMRGEAQALLKAIERDRAELTRRRLRAHDVTILAEAIELLENIEHRIVAARRIGRTPAEVEAEKAGIALRQRALEDLEYALLEDPDTEGAKEAALRIAKIREGDGVDDLIDDLKVIAPFLIESKANLKEIDVDAVATAKEAKQIAVTLEGLLASRRSSKGDQTLVDERNAAASLLWATMNKLRRVGRYAFRDRPKTARDYVSTYNRQRRSVAKAKQTREAKKLLAVR